MGTRDPRVDAYIQPSADLAKPILQHIGEIVYRGSRDSFIVRNGFVAGDRKQDQLTFE